MTEKQYARLVNDLAPKSPKMKDYLNAFWIGGLICTIGQLILNGYLAMGMEKQDAATAMSMTLPRLINALNSSKKLFILPLPH